MKTGAAPSGATATVSLPSAGAAASGAAEHELAHGGDHIGRCAVPLTAAALGQAHLAVHAADPVNDENDLGAMR